MDLLSLRDAAEAAQRRTSGLLVRQPLLPVLVRGFLQVRVHLLLQVPIEAPAANQPLQSREKGPQPVHDRSS